MPRPVILVVDDDPGVRESFRLILEDHHDVLDVSDGPQAQETVRAFQVDLVEVILVTVARVFGVPPEPARGGGRITDAGARGVHCDAGRESPRLRQER